MRRSVTPRIYCRRARVPVCFFLSEIASVKSRRRSIENEEIASKEDRKRSNRRSLSARPRARMAPRLTLFRLPKPRRPRQPCTPRSPSAVARRMTTTTHGPQNLALGPPAADANFPTDFQAKIAILDSYTNIQAKTAKALILSIFYFFRKKFK